MSLQLEWIDEREGGAGEREEQWMALLEKLLRIAGEKEQVTEGIVTLTLTDDEGIRELNRQYRGLDKPTDVLSFSLIEGEEPEIRYEGEYEASEESEEGDGEWTDEAQAASPYSELLGDIVISIPRAEAQAEEYGHSFERELGFLFVHGFLHVVGHDHADEAQEKEMFAKQELVLQEAGLTR
ncbi:rRNA maturation RNase YbeY [Cohnella endophytica]|uniref:Endoribonuclease YbeY n=1 Tax=Cohnella endophytica TaxID=2419778 RepID=A0A494XXK2_9BACL|nr:rRNA maturation RNase YbeY [Cohnella endophytica]RKP55222.1 rRNA maturation RNase YbeY [Cohnella endophytica]